jgi:hypothetical protein
MGDPSPSFSPLEPHQMNAVAIKMNIAIMKENGFTVSLNALVATLPRSAAPAVENVPIMAVAVPST